MYIPAGLHAAVQSVAFGDGRIERTGHAAVAPVVEVVAVGVAASPEEAVAHQGAVVEEPAPVDGLAIAASRAPIADGVAPAGSIFRSWQWYSRVLALLLAVLAVLEVVRVLGAPEPEELLALAAGGVVEETTVQLVARASLQRLKALGLESAARSH